MKRVVLADSHEVFRTGVATTISARDEYRIVAQCSDSIKLMRAISAFPQCVAIIAASLATNLTELRSYLRHNSSHAIVVLEQDNSAECFRQTFSGFITREITPTALLECVHQVAFGRFWIAPEIPEPGLPREDPVGIRVRDRLTNREMRIAALLLQGCKNREISLRLGTTEQVIRNCFRTVYEKSGTGDRLELALFIHHHRELAKAVARVAREIKIKESPQAPYEGATAGYSARCTPPTSTNQEVLISA